MNIYKYVVSLLCVVPGLAFGAAAESVRVPATVSLNKHELVAHGTPFPYDVAHYKNIILNKPKDLLVYNLKAEAQFFKTFPDEGGAMVRLNKKMGFPGENIPKEMFAYVCNEAPNYIRKQTMRQPLWTLSECIGSSRPCMLSRLESEARNLFDHDVAKLALEQYSQEKKDNAAEVSINYVDAGSGNLFQTMRTLTLLLESGVSRINIHLIDPFYERYLKRKQDEAKYEELGIVGERTNYLLREERFTQFAHWFKRAYPDRVVRIFVYDSLDDYMTHAEHNSAMLANIYVGSDLDFSFGSSTIFDEIAQKKSGLKETSYMKEFDEYVSWVPEGLLSYVCVPREKVLKPHGIGMLLYKGSLPGVAGLQHCIKILAKDEVPNSTHTIIFTPTPSTEQTRFMVLDKTYDSSRAAIRSRL